MSEFYASSDFLDRKQLFTKYYSLISVITLQASNVEYMANKLRKYSGFGMEAQISYLKTYSKRLRDYKDCIRTEYNSLVRIIDTVNDSERKAQGILGAVSSEYKLEDYNAVGNVEKNSKGKFSETFRDVLELYTKLGKNSVKIMKEVCDVFKGTPAAVVDAFKDVLGPAFNGLDAVNKVLKIIDFYSDGKVSFTDIAGTLSYSESVLESVFKITEVIGGSSKIKIMTSATTAVEDTIKVGGHYVGNITQYFPVLSVALSTVYSGAKTYDNVSADGVVDLKDWAEVGMFASTDGIIACSEGLLALAGGPVGIIGVGAFELADVLFENIGGKSMKDTFKDAMKDSTEFLGNQLGKLMGWAFRDWGSANGPRGGGGGGSW